MVQKIEIPVSANTGQAERAAEGLADAFNDVAAAVGAIGGASQASGRGFTDLLRRARETRAILSREFKQPISAGDTTQFMRNFAGMQPRSASLRGFRTEQDWYAGHRGLFRDARRAEEHRRRVLTFGMQGTHFAGSGPSGGGAPFAPGGSGAGGSGGGSGGSEFHRGVGRARTAAFGFGRSILALAGVGSAMAMAGRASDLATEEGTGIDTLKRRMGDLGVDFEKLRDQTRSAAVGLGVTFVESQRLAQAYAREVGNLNSRDNLTGRLRTSMGFSRAYGIDPTEGNQFFGQMARNGIGRDEPGQRRLALLIGDAVAKSGYSGKVDELLSAVADYSQASARMILGAPNVGAYANALTSLTSRGLPGLDPAGAAALLGTADAAMRRGGAMGDASLNFMYAAMRNASPGIKPVDALALMEGGLFGTTRSTFGPGSALSGMMGKGVGLNDATNLEKVVPQFRKFYGNNGYMLDAVKNAFGLNSHAQAAALVKLQDRGQLGASAALLGAAGIDPMSINASGFATIGSIANANHGGLQRIYGDIMGRGDLTAAQKKKFADAVGGAMRGGDDSAVRTAMVQAVASLYQEKTPGNETRQAVVDMTDKMTQGGAALLNVLNPIREAAVAIASKIVPGYLDTTGGREVGSAPWAVKGVGHAGSARQSAIERAGMQFFMSGQHPRTRAQAAAIIAAGVSESNLDPLAIGDHGKARGAFQWHSDRWNPFLKWARERGLDPNEISSQFKYVDWELSHGEMKAGSMLADAGNNTEAAAAAMVQFERPRGYHASIGNYLGADNWAGRYAQTQRLAAGDAPAAKVEGDVHVIVHHPSGKRVVHKVPIRPVGAAKPAGAAPPATVKYPTDLDYR